MILIPYSLLAIPYWLFPICHVADCFCYMFLLYVFDISGGSPGALQGSIFDNCPHACELGGVQLQEAKYIYMYNIYHRYYII